MDKDVSPAGAPAKPGKGPNELTAVAPEFTGRVTNRPTPEGEKSEEFRLAEEQERQEDA